MTTPIVGLAGQRGVGKTLIARHLIETHGYRSIHPFSGGKAACRGYFEYLGATPEEAHRMTDGDLKDLPCAILPEAYTPRFFMEHFGKFMGVTMGPEWTIGREILRERLLHPGTGLVAESIVYEADVLRKLGGVIIRVEREGSGIIGIETDAATARIKPDAVFRNDGSDISLMRARFDELLVDLGVAQAKVREPSLEPGL